MIDRELLELAAKAAGIKGWWSDDRDYPSIQVSNNGRVERWWNPLTDDGDALRLAVTCGVDLQFSSGATWVELQDGVGKHEVHLHHEPHGTNPYAATRRAIVRAAAEIGKQMP